MINLSKQEQLDVVLYIQETFDNYKLLTEERRNELLEVYESYRSFKEKKNADWVTNFKVNKAHEYVNKVLPRIIAKSPRWLVSTRTDKFNSNDAKLSPEERQKRMLDMKQMALGVQDYLTYIFDRYNLKEPVRLWAKNMLIYGNSYAKIKFKYETARVRGEGGKIEEKIVGEYPTIDAKSFTDIYVDPRYVLLEDMPAVIEVTRNVRFADLKRKKDKYINLDLIEGLPNESEYKNDPNSARARIFEITGIPTTCIDSGVDKNSLTIRTFYGYYQFEGEDENLYRVSTVNDMIVIEMEEITSIPFEDIKAFDDTETHNAVGLVEPIMALQDELNFKKNSASSYINQSLNRSWIWSPNSGINPADLNSKPNNIIATTKDAQTALANLQELPHRQLTNDYFAEQNDIERQMQAQTFTVDTSAQKSNQALTNTATGARIKFFESNVVLDELRKHLEQGLERLAYKLLDITYENMDSNIVIKKMGTEGFWEINKELLRDSLNRYDIKIETNSSSFDDLESRREDAIAFGNIMLQAAKSGVPVDFVEVYKDITSTFEKRDPDRFIKNPQPQQPEQTVTGQIQSPEGQKNPSAQLTEEVAKGSITTGV